MRRHVVQLKVSVDGRGGEGAETNIYWVFTYAAKLLSHFSRVRLCVIP